MYKDIDRNGLSVNDLFQRHLEMNIKNQKENLILAYVKLTTE